MTAVSALVLKLVASKTVELDKISGTHVHAAFLDILRQMNPLLAQRLHDENNRKPYTTSLLWSHEGNLLSEGMSAWVRFAILQPDLTELFRHHFLQQGMKHRLRIGSTYFAISDVYATPQGHSWAGIFTLERPNMSAPLPFSRVKLNVLSPTAFSRKSGKNTTYDTTTSPQNVWNYARRMWEFASGIEIGREFDEWCNANTQIKEEHLRIMRVEFKEYFVPGTVGTIIYYLNDTAHKHPFAHWWCHFAQFMPYSSIGYKTAMGLGQVRIETD